MPESLVVPFALKARKGRIKKRKLTFTAAFLATTMLLSGCSDTPTTSTDGNVEQNSSSSLEQSNTEQSDTEQSSTEQSDTEQSST